MRRTVGKVGGLSDGRGFTLVEMLIVVAMISIVAGFAVTRIGAAQRAMRLSNSARELTGWLEKTRLDSLRRHPMSNSEMASVTISSLNTYTVVIDQNGDGVLDPARAITIPNTHGARFAGIPLPTTFYYNWRGRPVNASGQALTLSFSLDDAAGNTNPVVVTGEGDTLLDGAVNPTAVSVNTAVKGNSNIKSRTRVP